MLTCLPGAALGTPTRAPAVPRAACFGTATATETETKTEIGTGTETETETGT